MLRNLRRIALGILILYLIGCVICAMFLAEATVHLQRRPIHHRAQMQSVVEQQFHTELNDASISAEDGTILRAWYVQPRSANGAAVILLHGVTDNREGVAGYAQMFLKHGYAVLLPDSRAHGESGGELATYGVKEKYDIRHWTEWLQQRANGCVYLFGESMGAAIALETTAVTPQLCAVAVESPYSTFREIAYDRFSQYSGLPVWFTRIVGRPVLELSLIYTRFRYSIDLAEANPETALVQSHVPALLIAGTVDRNIPARHALSIMRVANSHAELWKVAGADHGGAVTVVPAEFEQRVIVWFQSHPKSP